MKTKVKIYNDGFVRLYRKKKENLTVNRNITSRKELDFIIRLAYGEMSRRQQDIDFAQQNSFSLSLKIKTPRPVGDKKLDKSCFAIIGNVLYSIGYIDTNSTEFYFYLEKVRELEEDNDAE